MIPQLSMIWLAAAAQGADRAPAFSAVPLRLEGAAEPVHLTSGSTNKNWILEVNGNGVAAGDFDGDGTIDLVLTDGSTLERVEQGQPGFPPRLVLNDGSGRFRAAPEAFTMAGGRWGTGVVVGDPDNDGDLDLVLLEWGADRLIENLDGKGFREATERAGFVGKRWATSGAFLDYDQDGALDLAVINYLAFSTDEIASKESGACRWKGYPVNCGPEGLNPVHDQLYRGHGDLSFEDATLAAGFKPNAAGFGLGVITVDVDLDGDTDLYVTNDSTPNFLWQNQGDGTFREVGMRLGVDRDVNGKEQAGMGVAAGDWNGDGLPDLFVTNFSGENNSFYQAKISSKGNLAFSERSFQTGLGGPSILKLGWGTGFFDFDLDGDLDLFTLNGHVYPEASRPGTDTSYAQEDDLYLNQGGRFEQRLLCDGEPRVSRAGLAADLDGDGRLELVGFELDGGLWIHRAIFPVEGHWLSIRLEGRRSNRLALGARVELWTGESRQLREMTTAGGYQAAVPAQVHFGLGAAERIDRLVVHWPSGTKSELTDIDADQHLELTEPDVLPVAPEQGTPRETTGGGQ